MAAFAQLVAEDQIGVVTLEIEKIIQASLVSHPVRHLTRSEITRRFEMCSRIFESLRSELKWSLTRILDQLPEFLGCELDGTDWKPSARSMWTAPSA